MGSKKKTPEQKAKRKARKREKDKKKAEKRRKKEEEKLVEQEEEIANNGKESETHQKEIIQDVTPEQPQEETAKNPQIESYEEKLSDSNPSTSPAKEDIGAIKSTVSETPSNNDKGKTTSTPSSNQPEEIQDKTSVIEKSAPSPSIKAESKAKKSKQKNEEKPLPEITPQNIRLYFKAIDKYLQAPAQAFTKALENLQEKQEKLKSDQKALEKERRTFVSDRAALAVEKQDHEKAKESFSKLQEEIQEKQAAHDKDLEAFSAEKQQVEEQRALIAQKEKELETSQQTLQDDTSKLKEAQASLEKAKEDIEKRTQLLESQEKLLKEAQEALEQLQSELSKRDNALKEKEASFQERDTTLKEKETSFEERNTTLNEKETSFQERDTTLKEKETSFQEREDELLEREASVQEIIDAEEKRQGNNNKRKTGRKKKKGKMRKWEKEALLRKERELEAQKWTVNKALLVTFKFTFLLLVFGIAAFISVFSYVAWQKHEAEKVEAERDKHNFKKQYFTLLPSSIEGKTRSLFLNNPHTGKQLFVLIGEKLDVDGFFQPNAQKEWIETQPTLKRLVSFIIDDFQCKLILTERGTYNEYSPSIELLNTKQVVMLKPKSFLDEIYKDYPQVKILGCEKSYQDFQEELSLTKTLRKKKMITWELHERRESHEEWRNVTNLRDKIQIALYEFDQEKKPEKRKQWENELSMAYARHKSAQDHAERTNPALMRLFPRIQTSENECHTAQKNLDRQKKKENQAITKRIAQYFSKDEKVVCALLDSKRIYPVAQMLFDSFTKKQRDEIALVIVYPK